MKNIKLYIITFICTVIVLMFTLTISCVIPSSWIENNVKESSKILKDETWFRKIGTKYSDDFTEELMINIAYSIDSSTPFYSWVVARRNYIPRNNYKCI